VSAAGTFGVNDILGRRIDLIGNRTGMTADGSPQNIFDTGDVAFRAGGGRVFVAWAIVTLESAGVFDAGLVVELGSLAVPNDWSGATNPLQIGGGLSPVLLYPNSGLDPAGAVVVLPFYDPQTPFTATFTATGAPSTQTFTVGCYGWAEN
jgi:hypothetical protein